ncbi:MAG: M81 family metallopeptidase [Candidatus Bathyarchaeota archaeon]|nr:M81 family metallopeptidase [Candidatus Bathyarchaeota archaeon]
MRIAIASFSHETLTFCPEISTLEAWEAGGILYGPEALDTEGEGQGYITGMKAAAEGQEDIELVGILRTGWPKLTGYGSWITTEAFDVITGRIISRLEEQMNAGGLDGVLLALHGAMAVTGVPRPEAEIVRRVRKTVGDVLIMVTFDLHANEDVEMANAADAVFILKTYPHLDAHEIGETAGECMIETIRGGFKPTMAFRKPLIVSASVFQASEFNPMKHVYDRCREWEKKDVYCASVAPGFAYADVPDLGASVFVVTNDDRALAEEAAQDLHDLMWSLRKELTRRLPKAKEGVAQVIKMIDEGTKPVVIAYHDDRLGDGTHILKELINQGAENWCSTGIADPDALKLLQKNHKVGDKVTLSIGGWLEPISGESIEVTGKVEYLGSADWVETGPMGLGAHKHIDLTAALDLGKNRHVVLSERLSAPMSADPLKALGLDVDSFEIVEIKSRVHHKAYWDTWSAVDYPVDPPGLGPADLSILEYKYLPWDIYPIGEKYRR